MSWTDERVEQLKRLWTEGLSASQIARVLGEVTRNAVIGKVHRLGLSGRASPARIERPRYPKPQRRMVKAIMPEPIIIEEEPEPEPEPGEWTTVLTLKERMCKWPIGNPGDNNFRFCGRKAGEGASYCMEHSRKAYQPAHLKRDRMRKIGAA
jgi:GcrA cell cycle regulator